MSTGSDLTRSSREFQVPLWVFDDKTQEVVKTALGGPQELETIILRRVARIIHETRLHSDSGAEDFAENKIFRLT
jgi:hypothetical protein